MNAELAHLDMHIIPSGAPQFKIAGAQNAASKRGELRLPVSAHGSVKSRSRRCRLWRSASTVSPSPAQLSQASTNRQVETVLSRGNAQGRLERGVARACPVDLRTACLVWACVRLCERIPCDPSEDEAISPGAETAVVQVFHRPLRRPLVRRGRAGERPARFSAGFLCSSRFSRRGSFFRTLAVRRRT